VLGAFASTFKYNRKVHTVINTTMNAASRSIGTLATDLRTMNKQNMQLKAGLAAFKANRFKVRGWIGASGRGGRMRGWR
jgi:hypothetical protein